jgi:hypothetical protein
MESGSNDLRISRQADYNPDHYRFRRSSGLPSNYFFANSQRIERIGGYVLTTVMTSVAAFIVLGLWRGWFA